MLYHCLLDSSGTAAISTPYAPHAFDLFHDSETSREIIRQILAFLQFHLLA